jgi:hypothetical protein
MADVTTGARTWLDAMVILRERDSMLCHHWLNGGDACDERLIAVRATVGSNRTLADYMRAAERHFEEAHGIAVFR